jgi:hypothetical protein
MVDDANHIQIVNITIYEAYLWICSEGIMDWTYISMKLN